MKVRHVKAKPAPEAAIDSPHCAPQWPDNGDMPHIAARLQKAITGARALADLIHADLNLADDRRADDAPESLPAPFSQNVAFGLRMALQVCLAEITDIAEWLENKDVTPRAEPGQGGAA